MKAGDRTEKATPKRRQDAQRKGQSPRSSELAQGVGLMAVALLGPAVVPALGRLLAIEWRRLLTLASSPDTSAAGGWVGGVTAQTAMGLLPVVLAIALGSVIAQILLTGLRFSPVSIKPKVSHISLRQGAKRVFSRRALWELAKVMLKLLALGLVVYLLIWDVIIENLARRGPLEDALGGIGDALRLLGIGAGALALTIGLADAVVAKRRHEKELRMSRQQVKDEQRQTEGDPTVRGEMRRRQMTFNRHRMIAAVAGATVVITNPTHYAVALTYGEGDLAPRVVAKGAGLIALRIREEAAAHGVPIRENPPLARSLFRTLEIDDYVPAQFYRAVAEVVAAVYKTKRARL